MGVKYLFPFGAQANQSGGVVECLTKWGFGSTQSPCRTCQSVFKHHVDMKQQLLNVPDWLFFMSTVTGAGGLAAQSPTDKKQCFQS